MLLPIAGAAQRHRLRVHRPARRARASPACRRAWTAVGIAGVRRSPSLFVRRVARPRALPLHVRARRRRPAAAAARARRRPRRSTARASGSSIGPINFQPGEFAKIAARHLLRRLPRREARAARHGHVAAVAARPLPDPKHLGPVLLAWGVVARGHDRREGPRLVAAVLRPVRRDAVGGHRAGRATSSSAPCCSPSAPYVAYTPFGHVQDARRHLARPVGGPARRRASRSSQALVRAGVGRRRRHRARPRQPRRASRVVETDFIFAAIGEELGLLGATAVLIAYLLIVGAGLRIAVAGRARRSRSCSPPASPRSRRAVVHHHRRRHPAAAR